MGNDLLIPLGADRIKMAAMVVEHLKTNTEVDLLVFVKSKCENFRYDFIDEIANELRAKNRYTFTSHGIGDTKTIIISRKGWFARNPIADKIIFGLISAALALAGGILLYRYQARDKDQLDNQQSLRIEQISDSLNKLQSRLSDSLKTIRSDSSLLNK